MSNDVIQRTKNHVQELLSGEGSGHDWWHIVRVTNIAKRLAAEESADEEVVVLAALLHDVADWKFHEGNEYKGGEVARAWLTSCAVPEETINHVCEIINTLSFKGAHVVTPMKTIEGMVVQDADRLDAIGAIGIARAFAYGGFKNRELYNPTQKPELHKTFDAYKKSDGSTINHFYEKLLLLKDRMNTQSAKSLALERHGVMEDFLDEFFAEWNGEA